MLNNTNNHYGTLTKAIHWLTALLIFGLLGMGYYMADLPYSEDKLKLYALHKSFGLLVLLLVFVRVAWHIISKRPASLATHQWWEKILAHGVHIALYFFLFAMPLSGWVMSSAGDFNIGFFGLPMPDLVAKNESLFETAKDAHEVFALAILALVTLHMAGAFKHHFVDRDQTLARMTRERLSFTGGVVMVALAAVLMAAPVYFTTQDLLSESGDETAAPTSPAPPQLAAAPIQEGAWRIVKEGSSITFTAQQYGQNFTGNFPHFDGTIVFDPNALDKAQVSITISTGTLTTGAKDRDQQALSADWFNAATFPTAEFIAQDFDKTGESSYTAQGILKIRDRAVPITLPFTLSITEGTEGKTADMRAEITLKRLDFGIGQGQWQSTDAIADDVAVSITLKAVQ